MLAIASGVDPGTVAMGASLEEDRQDAVVGAEIFEQILATASGEMTKSEINGVGKEEFAPWSIGPTLRGIKQCKPTAMMIRSSPTNSSALR
jgi:hypothetical protein